MNSSMSFTQLKSGADFIDLLTCFLSASWTLECQGKVNFTPVGGEFGDWVSEAFVSNEKVVEVITKKLSLKEDIAVTIFYNDSTHGADLLFNPAKNQLTISWDVDRVVDKAGNLDFPWYMEKVKAALSDRFPGLVLRSEEHDSGGRSLQFREDVL
jgi:hypothetical protein